MTKAEFRELCRRELPANLRKLSELAENPKAGREIRRKARTLLRETLERLPASGTVQ